MSAYGLPSQPSQRYREQQIISASPLQRMLMVYDAAVIACGQRDLQRTTEALNLLRNTLDFEQGDVSVGLFRLYQFCADEARAGRFDVAADILRGLVKSWVEVLVRERDAKAMERQPDVQLSIAG
jgi:flagellar secretion chaperone FliS